MSVIPNQRGYLLAMNRDEKLSRAKGLPPELSQSDEVDVASPSEPGGGTWIAVNGHGVTFALINWYSAGVQSRKNAVTRGIVVQAVRSGNSPAAAEEALRQLPLNQINPFRLIGIFPANRKIIEWRWRKKTLHRKSHAWVPTQFASSGFDEPTAQRVRASVFREALKQKSAGTLAWLRQLHRSHAPERGPFCICMHRADAATVSHSEVYVSGRLAQMRHVNLAPCQNLARSWEFSVPMILRGY